MEKEKWQQVVEIFEASQEFEPAAVVQKTIEGDTLQFGSFQVGDSLNISVTSSRLQSNVIMNYYTVEVKAIAREAGSRSKIAVASVDDHVDPVGAMVGQRGVRVSTVTSELGGEKIDIIEYEEDPAAFIASALSPAEVLRVELNEADKKATVYVMHDQQSLAIGRGGQNVRLAAKLTGWSIDIVSEGGPVEEEAGEADSEQLTANSTDEIADAPAEATPAAEPESAE
jgi:N utilization substance protein A